MNGFIGDPSTFFLMKGINSHEPWSLAPTIPILLFALFQMKFAIITPALVVGATAERIRFTSYVLFMVFSACLSIPQLRTGPGIRMDFYLKWVSWILQVER